MWFKKNKWKIIVPVLIVAVLAGAFYYGGGSSGLKGWSVKKPAPAEESAAQPSQSGDAEPEKSPDQTPKPTESAKPTESPKPTESAKPEDTEKPEETESPSPEPTESEKPTESPEPTESVKPTESPEPTESVKPTEEPSPEPEPDTPPTCTISISCATILNNMDMCDPNKVDLVPSSGWILGPVTVEFTEGETVFDVLQRVCREMGIHLEYSYSPLYGSVYVEGIHNLYEFDVGELSGWMYKVNGWFPNFGCSLYVLEDDDVICWEYTCDLGYDVGGGYSTG